MRCRPRGFTFNPVYELYQIRGSQMGGQRVERGTPSGGAFTSSINAPSPSIGAGALPLG